jgi:hypothetical protein
VEIGCTAEALRLWMTKTSQICDLNGTLCSPSKRYRVIRVSETNRELFSQFGRSTPIVNRRRHLEAQLPLTRYATAVDAVTVVEPHASE